METNDPNQDVFDLPKIKVEKPDHGSPVRNIEEVLHEELSIHDRIANSVTDVVGSMPFIYVLTAFVVGWMIVNIGLIKFGMNAFDDPWEFAVLLLISNQIQLLTPLFILVSQNRQQKRESLRAEQEYDLSLRTEVEAEAMFEYLRQMADRQDVLLRVLDMQQRKMIAMKEASAADVDRMTKVISECIVAIVKGLENRPCLAEVFSMDPGARERILDGFQRCGEVTGGEIPKTVGDKGGAEDERTTTGDIGDRRSGWGLGTMETHDGGEEEELGEGGDALDPTEYD